MGIELMEASDMDVDGFHTQHDWTGWVERFETIQGQSGEVINQRWTWLKLTGMVLWEEFRSGEPPKSRIRVGFGFRRLKPTFAVGFGFRVSGFDDWNPLSLSVSDFGFRVSSIETHFRCRFRVSGFGIRVSSLETNFRCRFRVSGFVDWNPQRCTFAVGFGFRVSSLETNFRCRFRVSGFVAWNQLSLSVSGFGFRVWSIEANFSCPFRVSGFVGRNHL